MSAESSSYVLVCAGEDSGDVLGEPIVRHLCKKNISVLGSGGLRMQGAGLKPIVEFEHLAVSGFGDVLPHYMELRNCYGKLRSALESKNCMGLIAIDYPGFNMKLCALAKKLGVPTLYVAPPQIWAWKRNRGKKLQHVNLAVLFDFEKTAYADFNCQSQILQHPFFVNSNNAKKTDAFEPSKKLLLLPGSRKTQALRNLKLFLKVASYWEGYVTVVAARESLVKPFEMCISSTKPTISSAKISVEMAPQDSLARREFYGAANRGIAAPGTVTLELAASGLPFVVAMVPDAMTYLLGSLFIKTRTFALPNIIAGETLVPEYICSPWSWKTQATKIYNGLNNLEPIKAQKLAELLQEKMKPEVDAETLVDQWLNA